MVFRFHLLAHFPVLPFPCMSLVAGLFLTTPAKADVVYAEDVIIDGSLCVGLSCATGENFGSDTLLLKQETLRIRADDTSAASSFPSNDWQLTFNDSLAGGLNKFSIDDLSAGRTPFTLEAGAPTHALYVEADGDIGFGTDAPAVKLHVKDGETPTLRLEQDGSQAFTPQIWDVAGNENNFFVRDVTNSAKLPFRIRPGALNNAILIGPDGNVLIGATAAAPAGENPTAALHVQRSDGTARFLVEETSTTAGNRSLMFLDNAGGRARLQMKGAGNAAQTGDWSISAGNTFVLQERVAAFNVMIVDQAGNMTIGGALITGGTGACSVTPCDAVFDPTLYTVPSIAEHAALMWEHKHLPAVGPTGPGMQINMTEKMLRMLNELEHAHIYIDQLNQRMQTQSAEIAELKALIAAK